VRGSGKIVIGVLVFASFLVGRVLYESHREWKAGEAALAANDREGAIRHLEHAIHWYVPGNPCSSASVESLWRIGQAAEREDPKLALLAYDSLRGSLHAIRSFYWPYKEWILRADERIADLRAREQVGADPALSFEKTLDFHRKALVLDERPLIGWVLVVQIGFLGWVFSVVGWIWKGFDREGRMHLKPSFPWIVALVVFFSAWVIGLSRA
jgi:hypothetical protein